MIVNNFKIFCLKKNYLQIYDLITKLQEHIYDIFKRYLITTIDKNIYINQIYELSKSVNINYNNIIMKYAEPEFNTSFINLIKKYENDFDTLYNLIETKYINENIKSPIDKNILYPLNDYVNENLDELINLIGFSSINDFIKFNNINLDIPKVINLHFKVLKIFKVNKITITKDDKNIIKNSYTMMNDKLFFRINTNQPNEIIMPYFDLVINTNKNKYICQGIFVDDYLNISSRIMTQVSFLKLFEKKKDITNALTINGSTDEKNFKIKYIKYCDIGEIIVYSKQKWNTVLNDAYSLYNKLSNKTFSGVMQEFSNKLNKAVDIYNIIKVLLLGTDEQINIAGMLFLILKDKKVNNLFISDIVYFSLNFVSQIKLKKINVNLKEEMEKLNEMTYENVDLKKQILLLKHMPVNVKTLAIEKINEMKLNNNDYYKQFLYVKTLLNFPWPDPENNLFKVNASDPLLCSEYLKSIESKLSLKTYGHKKIKEQLILQVAKWISNPNSNGCAISLNGPPGVGKTLIAKTLSQALDIPFVQITLGGQNDGELLHGHGYTYSGAQPGLVIKKILEAGSTRCILYLDELDKSCAKHGSTNEITSILIHLTDPNMNTTFQDRFFQGIDFPLDRVIIITSYNDRSKVDPILLDRFIELNVKPYNIQDKISIIKNYVMTELQTSIGFPYKLNLSDEIIKKLIDDYTIEPGVRDIKRKIELVLLKLNKLRLTNTLTDYLGYDLENTNVLTLTNEIIDQLIDSNDKIDKKKIIDISKVGVINGLYATTAGTGGITTIQVEANYSLDSNFTLKLTGSQGDVMKESVQCAFTCAIRYICLNTEFKTIELINTHVKKNFPNGFHIHTPAGATPKDGPSAGCAFTIGFISLILSKPFNHKVAMTGEIDLNSNVTKIGGLEYKLVGAKQAGITTVLVPKENELDIEEIKKDNIDLFNEEFKYILISNLDDAVKHCF
jgi:ATP-dependent Lon protease